MINILIYVKYSCVFLRRAIGRGMVHYLAIPCRRTGVPKVIGDWRTLQCIQQRNALVSVWCSRSWNRLNFFQFSNIGFKFFWLQFLIICIHFFGFNSSFSFVTVFKIGFKPCNTEIYDLWLEHLSVLTDKIINEFTL